MISLKSAGMAVVAAVAVSVEVEVRRCGGKGISGAPACLIYLDLEAPSGHVVDEVVHHSSQIVSRASQQIDIVGLTEAAEELVFIKMARKVIRKHLPTETL